MGYRVEENTLIVDVMKSICNKVLEYEDLTSICDNVVFDFDFTDKNTPTTTRLPLNSPRVYLIPDNVNYDLESTCNNKLTFNFTFVIEGFHVRNELAYEMAWKLLYYLRHLPYYVQKIDDEEFGVLCVPGNGTWDYDEEKQFIRFSLGLEVNVRV